MNETPKKIDDSTWAEIKMLQGKFEELHGRFGNLGIEKMELDNAVSEFVERERKLKEEWASLKKLDADLRDKLVTTYGEGSLNMENGTFIPPASPPTSPLK